MIYIKYKKNLRQTCLVIFASFLLSGCDYVLFDPKGQIGIEQKSLIAITISLMLIVVVPAILMAIIFSWKYSSNNKSATYNPNWCASIKLEFIIWIIPILIILFLAILTWNTTNSLNPNKQLISSKQPINIEVISTDWKWLFIYPKQKIATINEIVFPIDTPIKFRLTSNSVMNSFFIPQLGSQIYAMAGMQTNLNLIANEAGVYDGLSSNYSGTGFSNMKFKVVVTPDYLAFNKWISKVKSSKNLLDLSTFENVAIPSIYNRIEYFGKVKYNLFNEIIDKFRNCNKK